jgi:hypothetical protein
VGGHAIQLAPEVGVQAASGSGRKKLAAPHLVLGWRLVENQPKAAMAAVVARDRANAAVGTAVATAKASVVAAVAIGATSMA